MTTTTSTLDLATFPTPHLAQDARNGLIDALQAHMDGDIMELSVRYNKVTDTKPREDGKDYKGLLGISKDVLIGTIKKIAKGKKGWYVLLDATLTRQPIDSDGLPTTEKLGWTSIKGEGIKELKGTRNVTDEVKAAEAKKMARINAEADIAQAQTTLAELDKTKAETEVKLAKAKATLDTLSK